jgi:hypothetical protein
MILDKLVLFAFNKKMGRFAQMLKLDVNSDKKSISLELLLKGENSPIQITVGRYEILTGEQSGIKVSQISTSREWMTGLIQTFASERTIHFKHAKLLKLFL